MDDWLRVPSTPDPGAGRKGLSSFLLVTFIITYSIEGPLIAAGFRINTIPPLYGQLAVAAVMWVPALAAFLTVRFVTGEGTGVLKIKLGPLRPYLAAGVVIPGCYLLAYGMSWLLGLGEPDWELKGFYSMISAAGGQLEGSLPPPAVVLAGVYLATLLMSPFLNGFFGLGEEIGWRGYLLPKLMPLGKAKAYVLIGFIWGLWHLPLLLVGFTYPGRSLLGIPVFIALTTAFGAYLNELSLRNGNCVIAGWAHGVFNSQKFGVWPLLFPGVNPLLGGYAGLVGIVVWAGLALAAVARKNDKPSGAGRADR